MQTLPLPLDAIWLDAMGEESTSTHPQAIALLGSQARGDAGPFSDVDILFLVDAAAPKVDRNTFLIDNRLVVISAVTPEDREGWFTQPEQVVNVVAALREARALRDPNGLFADLQRRARAFVWTDEMQTRADSYASRELVGLMEEAHKGLEGLRRGDTGRLLNARFGLSWLLSRVVRIQRGILGNSDNSFYDDVRHALGVESRWSRLLATAFGVADSGQCPPSLHEEVIAGLHLYCETARLLGSVLQPEDRPLIEATVRRIEREVNAPTTD